MRVAVAARARRDWPASKVDETVERYLTAVGLWEHRDKKPGQVSGGMQQRAAVARAFAVEPRVLLLDEPFGALDALTRARLQAQLVELWQGESETEIVVMVTHGIDEAILLSDRIVVMANPPAPSSSTIIDVDLHGPATGLRSSTIPRSARSRSGCCACSRPSRRAGGLSVMPRQQASARSSSSPATAWSATGSSRRSIAAAARRATAVEASS